MRTLEFILILVLGAALALTIRDDLRQRASVSGLTIGAVASGKAEAAETASASQGQLRCSREARQAVNVGRAISRLSEPHTTGLRPMITSADLANVVAGP